MKIKVGEHMTKRAPIPRTQAATSLCARCGRPTRVLSTRRDPQANCIRRRRSCPHGHITWTAERPESPR